jgi:hypothetical protein
MYDRVDKLLLENGIPAKVNRSDQSIRRGFACVTISIAVKGNKDNIEN